jgi:hypothetical protein
MSARKLGRLAAGLLMALGLTFSGQLGGNAAAAAVPTNSVGTVTAQLDWEW